MTTETRTPPVPAADPVALIDAGLRRAIRAVLGDAAGDADPAVRPSQNPAFGDFQANAAMKLGAVAKMKPRDLAQRIVDAADLSAIAEPLEVAGPGFINVRLKPDALGAMLAAMEAHDLGVPSDDDPHPIVVDMCSVNVAKQMHVGHLRSTIIGDALARVFERRGRTVHRQNHLGDWGVPIAMVLHELRRRRADLAALTLEDLDRAYRDAQKGAGDEATVAAAKQALVLLQRGDPELRRDWQKLIDCTLAALQEVLDVLGVRLRPADNRGESFYNDRLDDVVRELTRSGVAVLDQGALVIRFEGRERGMIVRKSDGGYLYATTDMAAVRFRVRELGADRIMYVVDARQRDHFRDLFDAARLAGWDRDEDGTPVELRHVAFGSVLGPDGTPLKTRSGENVTLKSLLDEACARGEAEVRARAADPSAPTHGRPDAELREIGRAVGVGAIKYADLSSDLVRDYVFDIDRMISFEGNTGPYLQYAHARICSIFARAGLDPESAAVAGAALELREAPEKQLALRLLRYGAVVADVARSLEPHRLCTYLYDLAGEYSAFYQACPVLKAESSALRASRLRLCDLVRRVLADGLGLLGIEAPTRM
jgi:arginyl-tRNA synthetase